MRAFVALLIFFCPSRSLLAQEHEPHPSVTPSPQPRQDAQMPDGQKHDAGMEDPMMKVVMGPFGISMAREGSGTSWLPDATPMYAVHSMKDPWLFMLHGNVFVQYIDEGGDRGDDDSAEALMSSTGILRRLAASRVISSRRGAGSRPTTWLTRPA